MSQIILSQIAALFFGLLIGALVYHYFVAALVHFKLPLAKELLREKNKEIEYLLMRQASFKALLNVAYGKFGNDRSRVIELIGDIGAYKDQCRRDAHRLRYSNYLIDALYVKYQKATCHIEQLVHAQKCMESYLNVNNLLEDTQMASGKLIATYRKECELVESHLVDRFNGVEVIAVRSHYSSGVSYLAVSYTIFGYPALTSFSRTYDEGYMMSITYRDVIVYSEKSRDKSYFVQVCENTMLEFITKFDLKFGRK